MSTERTGWEDANHAFNRTKYGVSHRDLEVKGERAVRDEFNSGVYGHDGLDSFKFVSAWLADKDFVYRKEAASTAKAAAAAATAAALSAAEANTQARKSRNITIVFAVISTVISVITLFGSR
jgi:hypothetical protein